MDACATLFLVSTAYADSAQTGSKYIYDLYYEKEAISKQLYEWLLKNNYADKNLIAKWKKQGYEKVCFFLLKTLCISQADYSLPALLSPMHPDQRDQLQQHLHLSRASQEPQGGSGHRVRELRMPRMFQFRLSDMMIASLPAMAHHTIPAENASPGFQHHIFSPKAASVGSRRHIITRTSATLHTGCLQSTGRLPMQKRHVQPPKTK